jgi:hypothetical protein
MKLTTNTQVFVDGVMQANGGRNEKLDPGVERGGWARPLFDDEAMTFVNEVYQRAAAFLFGGARTSSSPATGACSLRRMGDVLCVAESAISAPLRQTKEEKCPSP